MKFKSFVDELALREAMSSTNEALKIKKKNWNFKIPNFEVDINDKIQHSLVQRAQLRTEVPLKTAKIAIQHGLEYIAKKIEDKKLTTRTMVSLTFTKSDFKTLVLVNPDEKYLRVSTIMNTDMPTKKDIKWNLNEFQEIFWPLKITENETFAFDCDIDVCPGTTFLVEPALFESTHEVFQQEDIRDFELKY
jgi:hypothetical protein